MRQRRTAVLGLVLLLVATVVARLVEDPGDVTAATAAQRLTTTTVREAAARPPAAAPTARPTTSSSGARSATTPTATAPTATARATSAAPHADADSDGSSTPAPNAAKVTVPQSGTGTITPLEIPAGAVKATGRTVRYSIEIEGGLPVSSAEVAATIHAVLTDPRGWQTKDGVRFVPVSPEQLADGAGVDVRVTLASPTLTARLCAPLNVTVQQVSCWNGSRSVLNLTRWMTGSTTYGTDLAQYRIYLISHEVGHGLGHGHVHCPAPGAPAPVMVQQTKSLEGCVAAPWPTDT